jgi:hypothetical protein
VRSRVKAGIYDAEKVFTENGFTWMIDHHSLINPPLPDDLQQHPSQLVNPETTTPMELVQDLLRPFVEDLGKVREELGAELRRKLDAMKIPRDELRFPETASETTEGTAETPSDRGQAETGVQRRSWLYRLFFGP